jgi:hypothetical protein
MGFSSGHSAITARFVTNWDAEQVPVAWPNAPFTPEADKPYVRFYIMDGEAFQRTIGDPAGKNLYRNPGLIIAQIHGVLNTGEGATLALADVVAGIFRNRKFSGIWSLTPKVTPVGVVDGRYQTNVTIPFQHDEVL